MQLCQAFLHIKMTQADFKLRKNIRGVCGTTTAQPVRGQGKGKGQSWHPWALPKGHHKLGFSFTWGLRLRLAFPFPCSAMPQSGMQRAPGIPVSPFWWLCEGFPKLSLAELKFPSSCHPGGNFPTLQSWFKFLNVPLARNYTHHAVFKASWTKACIFTNKMSWFPTASHIFWLWHCALESSFPISAMAKNDQGHKGAAGRLLQLSPEQPGPHFIHCAAGELAPAKPWVPAWTQGWFTDTKSNCAASVMEGWLRETFPDSNIEKIEK